MYLWVAYKTVNKSEGLKYKYEKVLNAVWYVRFAADEEFTLRAVGGFEG